MLTKLVDYYSRGGGREHEGNALNVLTYHRVTEDKDLLRPLHLTTELFSKQVLWLKRNFVVLSLPEAIELSERNKLPPKAVTITVDDGYRDSYDFIYNILKDQGVSACFFVATEGLEKGFLWEDEIASAVFNAPNQLATITLDNKLYKIDTYRTRQSTVAELTERIKYKSLIERNREISFLQQQTNIAQENQNIFLLPEYIKEMNLGGMTIGAHTHRHPILSLEEDNDAFVEIQKSQLILEEIIQEKVEYFAFPNGLYRKDFDDKHIEMVKKLGFKAAFSTNWGTLTNFSNERFKIKRFTPWDETELKFCLRLALNYRK